MPFQGGVAATINFLWIPAQTGRLPYNSNFMNCTYEDRSRRDERKKARKFHKS